LVDDVLVNFIFPAGNAAASVDVEQKDCASKPSGARIAWPERRSKD
jgi:hypothetical protein